jgi:hypothetical protein
MHLQTASGDAVKVFSSKAADVKRVTTMFLGHLHMQTSKVLDTGGRRHDFPYHAYYTPYAAPDLYQNLPVFNSCRDGFIVPHHRPPRPQAQLLPESLQASLQETHQRLYPSPLAPVYPSDQSLYTHELTYTPIF